MPTSSDSPSGDRHRRAPRSRHRTARASCGPAPQDVAAGYGGAAIVSGVSISVGPGEVVSVIGPNGAGKSTLLKAVTGRLPVMTGTVTFGDRNITNMAWASPRPDGTGFRPADQGCVRHPDRDREPGDGRLPAHETAADRQDRDKVLSTFPALADMRSRTASKLSGGERKMLAVARVLMLEAGRSRPRRADLQLVAGTVPGGAAGPGPAPRRLGDCRAAGRAEGVRGARGVRLGLHSGRGTGRDRRPGQRDSRPTRHTRGLSRPIRGLAVPAGTVRARSRFLAAPNVAPGKP